MNASSQANKVFLWAGIAFFSVLLVVGVIKLFSNRPTVPQKKTRPGGSVVEKITIAPLLGNGSLKMKALMNDGYAALDDKVDLQLLASSGTTPVVGYDLVLSYDPSALVFVSVSHSLSDYDVKVLNVPGRLTLSGILKKDSNKPWIFADTVLEQVSFKTQRVGKTVATFVYKPGATDESNLMSGSSQDILKGVSPLTVSVGTTLRLGVKETKKIAGTAYSLRLDKVTIPSSTCRDCFTSEDLTFIDPQKDTQIAFGFRSGGIAGVIRDETRAGGYIFKLMEADGSGVTVLLVAE